MTNPWLTMRWEKRGWGIYEPGTQKRIAEIPLAWKSSKDAEAITQHIVDLHNDAIELAN